MAKKRQSQTPLNEVLTRKAERQEYPSFPTHIPDVFVRMEKANIPDGEDVVRYLGRSGIRHVLNQGRRIVRQKRRMDKLQKVQTTQIDNVKQIARETGLRGLDSYPDGFYLTVYPSYSINEWSEEELREALGPAFETHASELLTLTVKVPPGQTSARELRTRLLAAIGETYDCESEEEIGTFVDSRIAYQVREAEIGELVLKQQVSIPDSAANVTESMNLATGEIRARRLIEQQSS